MKDDKPKVLMIGDSIVEDGRHFIIRHDENNKPNYFEWNGEEITEAQYRMLRAPSFP